MDLSDLPATAQQFLEQLLTQRQLSPLTQRRYAHALGVLHSIHRDLSAISGAYMQRVISQQHGAGLAPRSLAVMASSWRSYCQWAHKQGLLKIDSSRDLRLPKIGQPLPKALAIDQTTGYLIPLAPVTNNSDLAQAFMLRDQAVLEALYGCGLRTSELLGLDCSKTANSKGWLDLAAPALRVLGKGNKARSLPLPSVCLEAIVQWLAVRYLCLGGVADEAALFVGIRGGRLSGTELRRLTQRRAQLTQTGQGVHPHVLRHSYASHLLQSSSDLRGVQELLGHASIRATQVYTRLDFQHLSKVYDLTHPRAKTK